MPQRIRRQGLSKLFRHFPSPLSFQDMRPPYCAIPRDYLSDTLLLRAMGFFVSQHGQLGAIPLPPFLSVSPLESMQSGGAIPPPQKGYLSDTCAIPYENKANGCDTPLCDTISKGYCAIWGGISHWATKISGHADGSRNPWVIKFHGRLGTLIHLPVASGSLILLEKRSSFISLQLHDDSFDSLHAEL